MTPTPSFDDLLGGDATPEERERLRRVHDQLLQAGPPPELTPALREPPSEKRAGDVVQFLPRRRAGALLSLAAALALAAFLGGYLAGHHEGFRSTYKVRMHATAEAPGASASIEVGQVDQAGNSPLLVEVRDLRPIRHGYYVMYLTAHGKRYPCGWFETKRGVTKLRLSVPYRLHKGVGWVVTSRVRGRPRASAPVVLTT